MNEGKFTTGLFLILLGAWFFLQKLGIFNFSIIDTVVEYWPMILMFFGMSLIFKNRYAKLIVGIIYLAIVIYLGFAGIHIFGHDFLW